MLDCHYRPISSITPIGTAKKRHGSPGGPCLEKKVLRFDGKVLRAEGQAEPRWAMLSCSGWSLRQPVFAPNPIVKFTVHLLQTASPADNQIVFSREELHRRKPRHSLTSSCFGLVQGSGKWHREHGLSNHAKSEPSRVGRDWPVMSATRKLTHLLIIPIAGMDPVSACSRWLPVMNSRHLKTRGGFTSKLGCNGLCA